MPSAHGARSEAGQPIDASGELADGTKVDGVVTLRNALLSRPDLFAGTMTEKLMIYALGRGIDYRDMPAVRAILRDAARDNYRFSTLVLGVVHSTPFQMRTAPRDREGAPPLQTAQGREGKYHVRYQEIDAPAYHVAWPGRCGGAAVAGCHAARICPAR